MSCKYGSRKRSGSQDFINTNDIGVLCFAMGVSGDLCRLIDLIPSAIVSIAKMLQPDADVDSIFKKMLWKAAKRSAEILINELTGDINVSDFCSKATPTFPEEITFYDVYVFIAELVPILNLFFSASELLSGSSTRILDKIVAIWLYQRWFELCECKPPPEVLGCTDSRDTNYNPLANVDDGSCNYPVPPEVKWVYGCTDAQASNYNPLANMDNGTCVYSPPTPPETPPCPIAADHGYGWFIAMRYPALPACSMAHFYFDPLPAWTICVS